MTESVARRTVTVTSPHGLHARPATLLARLAREFQSRIELETEDHRRVQLNDVLQVMTLGCVQGSQLEVIASGSDSEAAVDAVAKLFEEGFWDDKENVETPQGT